MNHEFFMTEALKEAENAGKRGEVPVGAVIVKDGEIIGRGSNRKEELLDPTAHAEINAIKSACEKTGGWRLDGSVMYVTAEPCVMCAGAVVHARIARVIFGVKEPKFGGVVTHASLLDIKDFNHRSEWISGVMEDEIAALMKNFFLNLRKNRASH